MQLKFSVSPPLERELRQRAAREARCLSDTIRRVVEKGLSSTTADDHAAAHDEPGGRSVRNFSTHLAESTARAVTQLAADQDRSASYVLRGLVIDGLRARGLVPPARVDELVAVLRGD